MCISSRSHLSGKLVTFAVFVGVCGVGDWLVDGSPFGDSG